MKKSLWCLVFAFCVAVGANAYAEGATATYNDTNDIVNPVVTGNIKNVVITNSASNADITANNIFYIDQASGSVLNSAAGFAMTEDAPSGIYYMTLRYDSGEVETIPINVKNNIKSDDVPMLPLDGSIEDGVGDDFSVAFITSNFVNLEDYKTVKFAFTAKNGQTGYFGYYLKDIEGKMKSSTINLGEKTGKVFFGVRLTGIENDYKNGSDGANVSMWLSKDENWKDKGGNQ